MEQELAKLPKVIEDLILDYKAQLDHVEKYNDVMEEFKWHVFSLTINNISFKLSLIDMELSRMDRRFELVGAHFLRLNL